MIVVIRPTPGGSWQGIAIDAPDDRPSAIWTGSSKRVKDAYIREYKGTNIQFIELTDGWDRL